MHSTLAYLCLIATSLLSFAANATSGIWENGYQIYSGDIDGDVPDDLYFEYHPPIIILHGDIATPISMARLPNFVLYGTSDGALTSYLPPVEVTLDESVINSLQRLDNTESMTGDFNGDGDSDLFVHSTVPLVLHANGNNLPTLAQIFPTGSGATEIAILLSSATPEEITIRDSNGDGRDDIVITGDANITLLSEASGTFDDGSGSGGGERKVIFIHTDILGSPVAETTEDGTLNN